MRHVRSSLPSLVAIPWLLAAGCGSDARPASAVLITLDTTRADALGGFDARAGESRAQSGAQLDGAPARRSVTPHLDALARDCLRFPEARTVAPLTLPAHASMLTGLVPPRHGARLNGVTALSEAATTVAELARAAGHQTAAFVASSVLDSSFGLAQGFDVYDQPGELALADLTASERSAAVVVDAATRWLETRERSRPFFLWVHLFDPHAPHRPEPTYLARADGNPYLGEVAQMDAAVGGLLAALRTTGAWEDTCVVVVGDHGEGLGQHGESTHGALAFDSTLRVPLLVRDPARAGSTREEIRSVVDVGPTLLEAMSIAAQPDLDGRSLLVALDDPAGGAYFETYLGHAQFGWSPLAGWISGSTKYVQASSIELYDLAADRGETNDVAHERAQACAAARAALARVLARPPIAASAPQQRSTELLARIEALGYASAGAARPEFPDPLAACARPSPHQRAATFESFLRAAALRAAGRYDEALALLQPIAERDPFDPTTRLNIGIALFEAGRYPDAVPVLEEALRLREANPDAHSYLGDCFDRLGDAQGALRHLERAVELDPTLVSEAARAATLAEARGESERAARLRAIAGSEP
jgi:arylsulfatase A-like enzyme